MKKYTYRAMMASVLIGAMTVCGTAQAATNSWNVGGGTWDTSTSNWKAPSTWTDGDSALFTNRLDAVTVTVSGARSADLLRVGSGLDDGARYTFLGGAGISVAANNFVVQFKGENAANITILTNLAMAITGKISSGRGVLVLAGATAVSADQFVTSAAFSGDGTWGDLMLKDTATLTLANGMPTGGSINRVFLYGGTFYTPFIRTTDWFDGAGCLLNGARIVALPGAQNSDFFQLGYAIASNPGPYVSTFGVVFDSDTNNITINKSFKHHVGGAATDGGLIKLGGGTLTFSGVTNTYNGITIVSNGTLVVSNMGVLSVGDVTVANGATLSLESARVSGAISDSKKLYVTGSSTVSIATGVDETVYEFYLDGVAQKPGVWGRVGGSAANQSARFSGDGTLTVTHSPAPFSWNVGTGTWNLATTNWLWNGADSTWFGRCDALFTNRSDAVTVTLDGNLIAETIRVGNGSNNAKYTFMNGATGTLSAATFVVQGSPANFVNVGYTIFSNLTLTTSGKLGVGRWTLVIGGTSTVSVSSLVTTDDLGGSGDWGALRIQGSASVSATNGVNFTRPSDIVMNGGTLSTSFLKISDWGNAGRCVLNGVRLIGTTSTANANFIQVAFGVAGGAVTAPYGAYISNNGVLIDSGTNTLVIPVPLKNDFNGNVTDGGLIKLGSGMLTLSGTNTYNGATVVSNGTLSVNGSLTNANITVSAGATLTGSGTLRCRVSSASNDRITVLGTATLSGLTLALNVQGLLPAGSYVLAQGLGAAQFKAITGLPQQAGQLVNVSYVTGQLVLVVSNKGTMIRVL